MGVDPGVEGGVSILGEDGHPVQLLPFHSKMTESELVLLMTGAVILLRSLKSDICYFEKVGFIKGDGGKGAFTFGVVNGLLRGALIAQGVRPCYVAPMMWQSRLQCLSGGNKNVTKRKAIELYPNCPFKITHNTADALLIGRFGWERTRF